jgi:acetyl esterase
MANDDGKSRRSLSGRQLRRRVESFAVESFFRGTSGFFRALPIAAPHRHGIEVLKDLRYSEDPTPAHGLDIYRPRERSGPLPVVFYVHGGGFRILSKESHWVFGLLFARQRYLVVSIDYRLAPRHRFPTAVSDTFLAWQWTLENVAKFGGDPSRIIVAGESAGANLVTGLTLATCAPRPEPWARAVYDAGVVPVAALPACGLLQVSDPGRFDARAGRFVRERIAEIVSDYLGSEEHAPSLLQLADPLLWLESDAGFTRPLPPFFAPVGSADVLDDDTRRLDAALRRRGAVSEAAYYRGGIHAFHAFVFDPRARQCWRDTFAFLERHVPTLGRAPDRATG